ncbi:MAG: citramalate synthase [Trueperaceae bacterium]|nr:citramalate synthase [Trueperaceae bacterium]MCC6312127.1 citramalate synthase [Trueperaceae bacterium]MCO5174341.1 citramalate synthase [Trueperaceae bacterium]MCW5820324.1 citramalate synthase [Trueperaceae bacterium]
MSADPTAARVEIYDTTLRDGTQGQDVHFTEHDKVAIAKRLDAFRVDFIEGGWPGSNPKDARFFDEMKGVRLEHAKLTAFGSTRHKDAAPEDDGNLRALLDAGTEVLAIFGKSWTYHVEHALGATLEQNLAMIESSVAYLRAQGRRVLYLAEHFFDGHAADPDYAVATLRAALAGGAERVVLCDTNGGSLPERVHAATRAVVGFSPVPVGIHAHNDGELAVANSLAAVQAGATHVQGTINGYGERCGNANLVSIIANLALKLGRPQPQRLEELKGLSRYVDERANLAPNVRAAYVGDGAFAHKGGIHVSAVNKHPQTYEHVEPESVGNRRRVLVSDLSGRANVVAKLAEWGEAAGEGREGGAFTSGSTDTRAVVAHIKELEARGYAFEGAEASFQLLTRKLQGGFEPYFHIDGFTVMIDKTVGAPRCEATVRLRVGDHEEHSAASGDGPVNALDRGLLKALGSFYPALRGLTLRDYKVRVLSGPETGTASVVRVQVEMGDGTTTWSTVGASTNIIEASYEALLDAYEYKLVTDGVAPVLTDRDHGLAASA